MDVVHGLLRTVVRGFYDIRAIIVLEAVLTHHVLSDRELALATGIPVKDVRATCARLREDHLLKEVSHKEEGGFGTRAYTQTVYFVHFTEAVDAIKWKMHIVESKLKEELDHQHNAQDYVCDVCGSHYETIDALALFDPSSQQFLCGTCGNALREEDAQAARSTSTTTEDSTGSGGGSGSGGGESHMEEFMTQLKPLIVALKKIDELSIPENSLEAELREHVPLSGFESLGAQDYNLPAHLTGRLPGSGAGGADGDGAGITIAGSASSRLPQQVQSSFQVNITSEAEQRAANESASAERQRLAEENALPEWHSQSTVSTGLGAPAANAQLKSEPQTELKTELKTEPGSSAGSGAGSVSGSSAGTAGENKDTVAEDAMDAYFKQLQDQQEGEEEEEDDDDEFESIV